SKILVPSMEIDDKDVDDDEEEPKESSPLNQNLHHSVLQVMAARLIQEWKVVSSGMMTVVCRIHLSEKFLLRIPSVITLQMVGTVEIEMETAVMELRIKIESLLSDNRRLEAQVADYANVVTELEAAKAKIKLLRKKLKCEAEQNGEQILTLQDRICITTSTSASLEQILPWMFYHKVIGVSTFFLFVEGKAASPAVSKVLESIPVSLYPVNWFLSFL
ncbi:hypothetical protein Pfo_019976, partial [Paulownia fortunei]